MERLQAMPADMAAAFFVTRRAEGMFESEQALLAEWLAADSTHAQALEIAQRGWSAFDEAENDEILTAMRAHALSSQRRFGPRGTPLAIAAAILVLVLGASLLFVLPRSGGPETQQVAWTRYEATPGKVRSVTLTDGSVITLDTGSVAEAQLSAKSRVIRFLRGRALFEVSHDPSRLFVVTVADRRIVDLGTRFEVDMGGDALKVTLLHGKVDIEPAGTDAQTVTLTPGQQFVERGGVVTVETVAVPHMPMWSLGLLDFNDVPLGQAVNEINRYSRDHILVRDSHVSALRISGQFRSGDAARFATTVAELYGFGVIHRGNEIDLIRK